MTYILQQYKETLMITTPRRTTTTLHPVNISLVLNRAAAAICWPFTNRRAAPLWLLLRLYVAYVFVTMGIAKIEAGFLTSDPIGAMLGLVANGTIPVPFEFYRSVAGVLVGAGLTPMISHTMPFLELAVALSMATGVLTPLAAAGALLLNINFVLSGIGTLAFDGPYMAAEILMLLGAGVVGTIGFEKLALRIVKSIVARLRAGRAAQALPGSLYLQRR
jgi:thiosulfate dehydrogenase [quinone] large subunit